MKTIKYLMMLGLIILPFLRPAIGEAALTKGAVAPSFTALETHKKVPMIILYFFKHTSNPSIEGLENLKTQYALYQKAGIKIIAISKDPAPALNQYLKKAALPFPVVNDTGKIFKDYGVQIIFPTTIILGPGGRVTDTLEGGGPSSKQFITTVAQRSMQLKQNTLAKTLYTQVLKNDPKDVAAQTGLGEILLKEGKFDQAQATFSKVVALNAPEAILGKEGLAALHLEKGETAQAIAVAEEIQKDDPENGLVHLIKANVLASRGDQDGALSEYNEAIDGKLSTDLQRAEAYNQAGRIHSERGNYDQAESMYQQAVNQNPYSSEILTNSGALYEKQGQPHKALAFYQEALTADPADEVAQLLSIRITQHLEFKEDMARQERVDKLVTELADRFKAGRIASDTPSDHWSSRPMTVAFLGLKSIGSGGLLREGMTQVLQEEIAQKMMSSQRISMVEREILEKLLMELKLGSSELADPETALKLGKILAARLIVTGSLIQVPNGIRLSLRIIDPETSAIKMTYSDEMGPNKGLMALADATGRTLSERIRTTYPLRGKIALVEEDHQVIVNLGRKHGMQAGVKMKIIADGDAIMMDGKVIGHRKKKVGLLEIVSVEEGLSYAKLTEETATIQKDQKVLENVEKAPKAF